MSKKENNKKEQKTVLKKPENISILSSISMKWLIVILIAINFVLYFKTLSFQYTFFDDDAILMRNEEFLKDFSNIKYALVRDAEFQKQAIELYRPLQNISYFIDVKFFGFSPKAFHFTNLILHLLNSVLLFLFLLKLKFNKSLAFVGSLLYSVHPMFAFTVGWIPARGDLLLAFWSLLSLLTYFQFVESKQKRYLVAHIFTFGMALLSKESAIALIPILLLYSILISKDFKIKPSVLVLWISYIVIIAVYFYLRKISIVAAQNDGFGLHNLWYNLSTLPESFLSLIIPIQIPLLAFYSIQNTIIGSVLLILFSFLVWNKNKNRSLIIWAIAFILAFMLPSMMYKPDWNNYIYDYLVHRNYFPFVGFLILFLMGMNTLISKFGNKFFLPFSAILLLFFFGLNLNFSSAFSSQKQFWQTAVKTNPKSSFAQNYYANALLTENDFELALTHYNQSLALKSDFKDALLNKGVCLIKLNRVAEAITTFTECLEYDSLNIKALKYRASAFLELKNHSKARIDLNRLIVLEPENQENYYNRAVGFFLEKNYSEAERDFLAFSKMDSTNIDALKLLSVTMLQTENILESIEISKRILQMNPEENDAKINLAYAYWENKENEKSQSIFQNIYTKDSANLDALLGLALCYSRSNRTQLNELIKIGKQQFPKLNLGAKSIEAIEADGYIYTKNQKEVFALILR